jgi:hypothetical protein
MTFALQESGSDDGCGRLGKGGGGIPVVGKIIGKQPVSLLVLSLITQQMDLPPPNIVRHTTWYRDDGTDILLVCLPIIYFPLITISILG